MTRLSSSVVACLGLSALIDAAVFPESLPDVRDAFLLAAGFFMMCLPMKLRLRNLHEVTRVASENGVDERLHG